MEVHGMKRNKEVIEIKPKVKVSLKIVPFGNIIYKTAGLEHPTKKKKPEVPIYVEPITTNVEMVEIRYEESQI